MQFAKPVVTKKIVGDIPIEFSVAKFLRPYQVVAVRFILDRLTGKPFPIVEKPVLDDTNTEKNDDDDQFETPIVQRTTRGDSSEKKKQEESGPPTGCILADEMGLGKTLTSIAVIYTLHKALKTKAAIVCPSSLVENWEKEIKKWLGVKVIPLVARPHSHLDDEISLFTNNNVPVLIISYEMFKKYAKVLNKCEALNLVICDEGHRLKNSSGNQTTISLNEFRAKMRLVLSGTVIQNDLEELYSVVEFCTPSYLGSLSYFRKNFSNPINAGSQVDATKFEKDRADKAQALLKEMLGKIMIRRTQSEILSTLLPPKTNYFIFAKLTKIQEEKYGQVAKDVCKKLGIKLTAPANEDEAEEDDDEGRPGAMVLPSLQKLRKYCNTGVDDDKIDIEEDLDAVDNNGKVSKKSSTHAVKDEDDYDNDEYDDEEEAPIVKPISKGFKIPTMVKKVIVQSKVVVKPTDEEEYQQALLDAPDLLKSSSKLQILDLMLSKLRVISPEEKVVVISNFTSCLDQVEVLAKSKGWGFLRIDGSIQSDKRQNLVDCFNRASDPRFIFLLSSKAGGVGLNLIGGSRLVMLDPDWNPATDAQAMARVWRTGQLRPVFIYRIITLGKIEDAILQRQGTKGDLADGIFGKVEKDGKVEKKSGSNFSLTKADVKNLMFPTPYGSEAKTELASIPEGLNGDENMKITYDEDETNDEIEINDEVLREVQNDYDYSNLIAKVVMG